MQKDKIMSARSQKKSIEEKNSNTRLLPNRQKSCLYHKLVSACIKYNLETGVRYTSQNNLKISESR